MNATNSFRNNPNITTLLMIAVLLLCLILSKKCAAQTVPVDKDVLKYLFNESANAFYLRSDIKLCDSINSVQSDIIDTKDSLLSNANSKAELKDSQIAICEMQNKDLNAQLDVQTKEVKKFKILTWVVSIIGSISTAYFIVH